MPSAGSITGVPTIPTVGVMSPQGSELEGTGVPALACHAIAPVAASSAYTSSPTVATYTREPTTRGCPQMGAPRLIDCHANTGVTGLTPSGSEPERSASWW